AGAAGTRSPSRSSLLRGEVRGREDPVAQDRRLADDAAVPLSVCILGILAIMFLQFGLFRDPASAWTVPDHRLIAMDAITVLPEPLKQAFEAHQPRVLSGVIAPDFDPRRGGDDHMLYLVAYRGSISRRGNALFLLQEFAEKAEKHIRNGSD